MTKTTISQTPFDIPVRRDVRWDFSDVDSIKILDDDILVNYLWLTMSLGAPAIEKFFIMALSPLSKDIKDDQKMREDMENMIAQEALHSATHAKFNRALEAAGVDIRGAYAEVDKVVEWVAENYTKEEMVGMVAAGEHMLYSFAVIYMKDPSIRAAMTPAARRLFDYHLMEEAEHGAVSHDMFRYFCGDSYWMRLKTAFYAVKLVRRLLSTQIKALMDANEEPITWRNKMRFMSYCFGKPGLLRLMGMRLLEYISPFYHLEFGEQDLDLVQQFEREVYATQPAKAEG